MSREDPHRTFRESISDRLDGPLDPAAELALRAHMASCPRCRMVERGYLRARQALRSLPGIHAPRDLWARTTAALDRELARRPGRRSRHRDDLPARPVSSPALMLAALASIVLAVAVMGSRLAVPEPIRQVADESPRIAAPTPFEVPTQELAVIEFTADGLAIYETTIDRACPPTALDCIEIDTPRRQLLTLSGELTASSLDLHQAGGRLAVLTADELGRETVSVVLLPPEDLQPRPADPPDPPPPDTSPPPPPDTSPPPPSSIAPTTGSPGDEPTVRPPGGTPRPTAPPDDYPRGSDRGGGDPSHDVPVGTRTPGTSPDETPSDASLAPPTFSATPTTVPAAVNSVLEDVLVVGAPPAWSSEGSVLAFSAMPADHSRGPDIYTWRVGDARAQRLTQDHGSYFASWSGTRIVVGRVTAGSEEETFVPGSVVIDPASGEQRPVKAAAHWLPVVDPTGRFAIAWLGELGRSGRSITAMNGALYLIDWQSVDPFRVGRQPSAPEPTGGPIVPDDPGTSGTDLQPDDEAPPLVEPSVVERPSDVEGPSDVEPPPARGPHRTDHADTSKASSTRDPGRSEATRPTTAPLPQPQPLEPSRDPQLRPVREWQVGWSDDGTAMGFWVSESVDETWGKLSILRLDTMARQLDRDAPLLPPTLARRAFSLGLDRVAWVGASGDDPDGELRLRTWGGGGDGGLRIQEIDLPNGLPAF